MMNIRQQNSQPQFRWVWYSELGKSYEKDDIEDGDDKLKVDLRYLSSLAENKICSDCGTVNQCSWASVNLGVFLCIRCASYHRSLPKTISRPKSTKFDLWSPDELARMKQVGNVKAIKMYGGPLPDFRPSWNASDQEWKDFLMEKYGEERIYAPKKKNITLATAIPLQQSSSLPVSIEMIDFLEQQQQTSRTKMQELDQNNDVQNNQKGGSGISQLERDISWFVGLLCEHCCSKGNKSQQKKIKDVSPPVFPASSVELKTNLRSIELPERSTIAMTIQKQQDDDDTAWTESDFIR